MDAKDGATYFHKDHLNSNTILTNEKGKVIAEETYAPYGGTEEVKGSNVSKYKYTGKEKDRDTGLYDYGARFYDPGVGRFIQPDPLLTENPEKALLDPIQLNSHNLRQSRRLEIVNRSKRFVYFCVSNKFSCSIRCSSFS